MSRTLIMRSAPFWRMPPALHYWLLFNSLYLLRYSTQHYKKPQWYYNGCLSRILGLDNLSLQLNNRLISLCLSLLNQLLLHLCLFNGLLEFIWQISFSQLEELDWWVHHVWIEEVKVLFKGRAYRCPVHEEVVGIPIGALYNI